MNTINRFHFHRVFKGHPTMIFSLAAADDQSFYSGDASGNLIRWSTEQADGKQIARLGESILKILPDPEEPGLLWCTTLKGNLVCLDQQQKKSTFYPLLKGGIFELFFSGDDIYFSGDEGLFGHCKKDSYYTIDSIQLAHKRVRCFIPQESHFIAGNSEGRIIQLNRDPLDLVHVATPAHEGSVLGLAAHPGGFISCGSDGQIIRWSADLRPLSKVAAHNTAIYRLLPEPAAGLLFSGSRDGSIRIWEQNSLRLVRSIDRFYHEGHYRSVNDLLWLPGPQLLISCSDDREIRSWRFE